MGKIWYLFAQNNQEGPFTLEEMKEFIKNKKLKEADLLVFKEGMADWAPYQSLSNENARSTEKKEWMIYSKEKQFGPYNLAEVQAEIKKGNFKSEDLCFKEGFSDWKPIKEVKEFYSADKKKKLKDKKPINIKIYLILLLVIILCVLAMEYAPSFSGQKQNEVSEVVEEVPVEPVSQEPVAAEAAVVEEAQEPAPSPEPATLPAEQNPQGIAAPEEVKTQVEPEIKPEEVQRNVSSESSLNLEDELFENTQNKLHLKEDFYQTVQDKKLCSFIMKGFSLNQFKPIIAGQLNCRMGSTLCLIPKVNFEKKTHQCLQFGPHQGFLLMGPFYNKLSMSQLSAGNYELIVFNSLKKIIFKTDLLLNENGSEEQKVGPKKALENEKKQLLNILGEIKKNLVKVDKTNYITHIQLIREKTTELIMNCYLYQNICHQYINYPLYLNEKLSLLEELFNLNSKQFFEKYHFKISSFKQFEKNIEKEIDSITRKWLSSKNPPFSFNWLLGY